MSGRFALEAAGDEGVLLDSTSGVVYALNGTATSIWRAHLEGRDADEIAAELAARFGVELTAARRDVSAALDLAALRVPPPPPEPFQYLRRGDGYALLDADGQEIFAVDPAANTLRFVPRDRPALSRLRFFLHRIAPKLLALEGRTVLHASAVERDGALLAFSGLSGAGKTTTAETFGRAGWNVVALDKVVLRVTPDGSMVDRRAEQRIQAWVDDAAVLLSSGAPAHIHPLQDASDDDAGRLTDIAMLDVARREGSDIHFRRLTGASAVSPVFKNLFFGSSDTVSWVRQLRSARDIALTVRVSQTTMPDGLGALERAASRYSTNEAS